MIVSTYPNPFNSSITIEYGLSEAGRVRINIYDLMGRMVETLNDSEESTGHNRVTWDASRFPSGVYFARLESAGRTENIKMVLLK
jgi:flagellar hook assembly protein FlgD